jgi:hypothetical protein
MKKMNKLVITSIAMATLIPALHANAQYKATGDDGITASPRLRQRLNEQGMVSPSVAASTDNVAYVPATPGRIAASPRARAQMDERNLVAVTVSPVATVATRKTRSPVDGIAASPKLLEQMRDRVGMPQVDIAPITPTK